ncbi:MAG: hypothetical protein II951_05515 [Bacteroidales bacterium]|jgi:hypothetical protein|nr:hypothetical protein [Bacteroidales bacterium]
MKISRIAFGTAVMALMATACTRTQPTTNSIDEAIGETTTTTGQGDSSEEDLNKSKTILYTMPAPIEMASLIKETGVRFDDQLLHDLSAANKYNTNLKMALSLGAYATDMSVSGMFSQSQKMVDYLKTLKDITRRLGIVQIMDENAIRKLEGTNVSKDEMLNVISEVYMNTNQYLTENNRRNVATMVMAGGWVEGLYLALNLIDTNHLNKDIVERIIAQKLALATMQNIVDSENSKGEDADLTYISEKMQEIKAIFDYVEIAKVGRVSALTDPETKTTAIKANTSGELNTEIVNALKQTVTNIRNEFVK